MRALRLASLAGAVLLAGACALTRSQVKGLRDRDASRVRLDAPIRTTIAALDALPSHCGPAGNHRIRDEEFHVYEVVGRVVHAKRERDHDVHIVLEDPEHASAHLVVELDDPDYRRNMRSPYRARLTAAKRMFDDLAGRSGGPDSLKGTMVRVTGVGFFDITHLQRGRSRSCIELHPLLAIEKSSAGS